MLVQEVFLFVGWGLGLEVSDYVWGIEFKMSWGKDELKGWTR